MGTEKIALPELRAAWPAGVVRWLRAELAGFGHLALWVALGALLLVFLLRPQLPLHYRINVGQEVGLGSDLPYLRNFNDAEYGEHGTYRWTRDESTILLPGIGRRSLVVALRPLPLSAEVQSVGPQSLEVLAGRRALVQLPMLANGGRARFLVPADLQERGRLELTLRSATFSPTGDPRLLGVPLDSVTVTALPARGVAPDWSAALGWLGVVTLGWLALRHALGGPPAVWALALLTGLVALAALFDPPRWAFGTWAALAVSGMAYLLAILTRGALPRVLRRLGAPLDAPALAWLSLLVVVSFALRYGGRLYPESMPGDIGFHHNRFLEAIFGQIYIVSVNRGVPFPYPPGPYTLVAPLTLVGLEIRTALQLVAALADALSAVVVYVIAVGALGRRGALLAAGIYVFTAATFMTTWWSFSTHIYTQLLHLLLIAALLGALAAWQGRAEPRRRTWTLAVMVLLALVFLGHFGFLINTALLVALLVAMTWLASWRGAAWARRVRWPLTLVVGAAGAFAAIFFYSAYLPLFLEQLATAREGGLTAVANRAPVSRTVLWNTLWRAGFITHFGLFPLLLMPAGLWLLARRARSEPGLGPQRSLLWLMVGSLAVAGVFAIFPFVAGVSNSPRWLMFIAWVVAVGAAVAVEALWRRGRWGRVGVLAMGALTLANTAWIWLGPMLWRIRPPEPF
jgi:hypothetical protein